MVASQGLQKLTHMENEPPPNKTKWYSIQEAAEYLDVGEPTLYRWMREGKITFRKVGDSTRFWQEDLDAVMQVYHSAKDLERRARFARYAATMNCWKGMSGAPA